MKTLVPCGLTATSYGPGPLGTVLGVSGRSAPEPREPNWETSFPPVSATYTNGARAADVATGRPAAAGVAAAAHPTASPQAVTASPAARPAGSSRLARLRFLALGIGTVPRRRAGFPVMSGPFAWLVSC